MPGAEDAWTDGRIEAWGLINDILGITSGAETTVDGAIDAIEDPRLKLLAKAAKKAGQTYAGKLNEQAAPSQQILSTTFQQMWSEYGNIDGVNSTWPKDAKGDVIRPIIDFPFLGKGRAYYSNDSEKLQEFDRQKAEIERWTVSDPELNIQKIICLFRGDKYDGFGYAGNDYGGVNSWTGVMRMTGIFNRNAPTSPNATPTPVPGG